MDRNNRRTILLLGGSFQQCVAIETAKNSGYRTVLCDYLADNPGRLIADKFYQVSTTDLNAVLEVAIAESIDGVVAYSSDPAAPTAAYISEKLGLPGLPYCIAESFCEKHLFRDFLRSHGFHTPKSIVVSCDSPAGEIDLQDLEFPLIVKPTDSSGSKGVTVLRSGGDVEAAVSYAQDYSRNGVLIVEEYVERSHPHVIEAELMVQAGKIVSWGLIDSIRDASANVLLPAGYSYPISISSEKEDLVRAELNRLIEASGCEYGAFNIEMIIDNRGSLYFLDAGPRNGGNMLPEFISMISGKDSVKATICAAMGDGDNVDVGLDGHQGGYWGLCVLHASNPGVFSGVKYSSQAANALVREELQKEPGDWVQRFEKCTDLVGLAFFKFSNVDEQREVMMNMSSHIVVEVSAFNE